MTWRPDPAEDAGEPRPVADALAAITARLGLARPDVLGSVFGRWEELVGPDVAAHATPRSLRDGVLLVEVDHPAWASSLRILSGELVTRADEVVGLGVVTAVEVVNGRGRRR